MTWPLPTERSLIPACDVSFADYEALIKATADLDAVQAYKIGFMLALEVGLPKIVEVTRRYTDKVLIYDHQKAGTDIPATGKLFAKTVKQAGIDVVILFPQAGVHTQQAWIDAAREQDLGVIVGGWMTHQGYRRSDGGYLDDEGILDIYRNAARAGITDYVGPGNQPKVVGQLRDLIEAEGQSPIFYMPGFVAQGGGFAAMQDALGDRWHPIIGRGIYQAPAPRDAATSLWAEMEAAKAKL